MAAVTVDNCGVFDSEHHTVTLRASDGIATKRPAEAQLQDIRGPNGERDFYDRPSPQVKKDWLEEVGTYLAKMKGYDIQQRPWTLKALPERYELYTHRHHNKKGENRHIERTDNYLFGYPVGMKRFRSPNELKPHALWLCDGMPRDSDGKSTCECEYCTGKKVKSSHQQHQRASSDPHEQRQLAAQKAQKLVAGSGRSQPGSLAPPVQARNEGTGPDWVHLGQTMHIEVAEEREEDELPDEML